MKKFLFKNRINFLFLFISLLCLVGMLGVENIFFQNTKWVHTIAKFQRDLSASHTAWYFFSNDIWRFPLGNNPCYI